MTAARIRTSVEMAEEAALPCAHAVGAEPGLCALPEVPEAVAREPVGEKSPARWAFERLALYMKAFEEGLDAEHELAMGFTGAAAGVLRIEGIGYFDPDIVTFYGSDEEGLRTQLIQHVGQLNVLLRALPKPDPGREPRRIGFRLVRDLTGSLAPAAGDGAAPPVA